jgi:hypothetical protein
MTTKAGVTHQGYSAYDNIDDNVRYRDDEILVVRSLITDRNDNAADV